jgi:glutamate carboxypeptidase
MKLLEAEVMKEILETLERYVSMPSGSWDKADSEVLAGVIGADFVALGMKVEAFPGEKHGPVLECTYGRGPRQLMLMGHMDTVFPHDERRPFRMEGDVAYGSGVSDMKGGLVVMLYALKNALPAVDPQKYTVRAVLNADEELGSPESGPYILKNAKKSFAALSFEPGGAGGALTCERKGVTSFTLSCTGIRGHSGAAYPQCASAIQELCRRITDIYALRDDSRDISVNIGIISGGTAENVVADEAVAHGEFRYYDQSFQRELMDRLTARCALPGLAGTTTALSFGASHPALKETEASAVLMRRAQEIAREYGVFLPSERTGGAGDIAIAGLAGIPVLDGLGLEGSGLHTTSEFGYVARLPFYVALASRLIAELLP